MRQVLFYRTQAGECPLKDFLDSLPAKQAQKVVWVLKLIEEMAILPKSYFKKLVGTNGIWEARIKQGSDIFRILGFFQNNNTFIAAHGIRKKTDRIPKTELSRVERYRQDYLER